MMLIITFIILFCLIFLFYIGIHSFNSYFVNEVKNLLSLRQKGKPKKFRKSHLKGLPNPVKKYFENVLIEGTLYVNKIRMMHGGLFRMKDKADWIQIEGEQFYTVNPPGFVWCGKTYAATAIDRYIKGNGHLIVKLLSLFRVVDEVSPKLDQAEFLRWLTECTLFPTALLPSKHIKWKAVNSKQAKLIYKDEHMNTEVVAYFNEKNEIYRFKADRYKDDKKVAWSGYLKEYKEMNGVCVPTELEAVWHMPEGDVSYARFQIHDLKYGDDVVF